MGCITCGVLYSLNMALDPFVSFLPPQSVGKVGKTIEFLGQGFTGTTKVSFSGTAANFTVVSDAYLTAAVPNGAKTGFVTVTAPGRKLVSSRIFRVTPQIIAFDPPSGPIGTPVTITGISLAQTKTVAFGGVKATAVTVDSDTEVSVTVPSGAKTGRIQVTTSGGSAISSSNFIVTP
ncbi:MAG TPA: IPT/TIG domain-containing protein [Terriglobia bacterium]|nr:IPT/TIG domain-containing protein [Terriglobia bacterium]